VNVDRYFDFFEALTFAALVGLYIWHFQAIDPGIAIVFLFWLVISFFVHHDTFKTIGWRADNLWAATRQGLVIFVIFGSVLVLVGLFLGAWQHPPDHLFSAHHFVGYFAFCLLQQVTLNSYITNRFLSSLKSPRNAALLSAAVFGALHWPNPVLVPLTLIGGFAMTWLFAKERNILPLTLGQSILGGVIWWAFPIAWHHSMRVGPGYYSFTNRLMAW
jgi:membrane protease YdiL (CAAX protease family)